MAFKCGDLVMKCKPLVHTLSETQKSTRCDFCFKLNDCLLKCANCKSMYYCDKKCQKLDWNECHRNECKIFVSFNHTLSKDCDRFLLRLWLFIGSSKRHSESHELYNGLKRSFDDLMTHCQQIREDETRIKCFNEICNRFQSCQLDFDYEELFQLFCKICINSFSILNEDLNEIGGGIYICGSVLNHSCQPNAGPVFNGIDLEVRAIREIGSDEEVLINYIDIKKDRNERRERLKNQYYFDCNCLKCSILSDDTIDYSLVKSLDKQMDQLITDQTDWQKCYSIGSQTIPLYQQIYGPFHPDLTVQLMRVLKTKALIIENIKEKDILELIKITKNSIEITHGFKHKIFDIFRNAIEI